MKFIKKNGKTIVKIVVVILLLTVLGESGLLIRDHMEMESKTVKLGFEDIGELATQSCRTTTVATMEDVRKLGWLEIPFTTSKEIYSYDCEIKAGFDFGDITWKANDKKKTVTVKLPEAKVLSCSLLTDSLKVYYESESIFNNIGIEDFGASQKDLCEKAQQDAEGNGLLENAVENAKVIITGFITSEEKYKEYQVDFE